MSGSKIYLMSFDNFKTIMQGALGAMTFGAYHQFNTNKIMELNNQQNKRDMELIIQQNKIDMELNDKKHQKQIDEMEKRHQKQIDELKLQINKRWW